MALRGVTNNPFNLLSDSAPAAEPAKAAKPAAPAAKPAAAAGKAAAKPAAPAAAPAKAAAKDRPARAPKGIDLAFATMHDLLAACAHSETSCGCARCWRCPRR